MDYLYFCCLTAMQNRNKFSSKSLLPIAFTATLVILILSTVSINGKNILNDNPYKVRNVFINNSSKNIQSKKNHFSVAKKRNFIIDILPSEKSPINDTIVPAKPDTLLEKDTSITRKKLDTVQYKISKNAISDPVAYTAEDSMVIDVAGKKVTMYGTKVTVKYQDNNISGPIISFDQTTGNIVAALKRDSTGKVISFPTFKQGDFISQFDSIKFNMKSGKGITKSTYTQQGDMYVYANEIKRVSPEVFFALRGRFTTCDLDTPHFAFISNKIEFINNKMAISGPLHPEIEGVPIPIYFPFGIFPLTQGRHSGLLPPTFTTNQQKGVGLEGLGFYKVFNDYWDFILQASIYSYGGWTLKLNPRYSKKYHYSGNLSFDMQNYSINFKGDPDYQKNKSYHISWNHTADTKARPGVTFSGYVNAGSSSYNAEVANNPTLNYQNQMSSSISYSKTWQGSPFNLTLAANHDQNTNTKLINISLPTLAFTMNTIYPFRRKNAVGSLKWYENLGIGYNLSALNRFSFYDTVKNKSILQQIRDTLQWGAHHVIPISLALPQMGIFQLSPSVSYDETWYQKKVTQHWDDVKDTLLTGVQQGFYTARQMAFGLSATTKIYGMLSSKNKNAKIQAIRHVLTPTFAIRYQPNMNGKNYYTTVIDTAGHTATLPYFQSGYNLNSPYSNGKFAGFDFGIDNNVTMKVRNKSDTGKNATKKVSLLDNLGIHGSYNLFPVDFRHFSNFSANASNNLFNKVNITAGATFDPYEVNSVGIDTNILVWKTHPISLGRLVSANISLSSSFKGGNKKTGEKAGVKPGDNIPNPEYDQDLYSAQANYIRNNPGQFADFNIPWSINLSYSLLFSNQFQQGVGFKTSSTQSLNFNGTLNVTPKWQMAITGFYNLALGQLTPLSFSLSRDLH
ncbi:MAG TPA: putative LPS assembly protein LptD, partial [Hanamia sp.]